MPLHLDILAEEFGIARLAPDAPVPAAPRHAPLWSLTRTRDELSLIAPVDALPAMGRVERGWRCLRVRGPLSFEMTGVLASLAGPLADADVPILAVSTYDTDYLLVRDAHLAAARETLTRAGHIIGPTAR
jgi:hypothetical protein